MERPQVSAAGDRAVSRPAAFSACSSRTVTTALIEPLTASIRRRCASITSDWKPVGIGWLSHLRRSCATAQWPR